MSEDPIVVENHNALLETTANEKLSKGQQDLSFKISKLEARLKQLDWRLTDVESIPRVRPSMFSSIRQALGKLVKRHMNE